MCSFKTYENSLTVVSMKIKEARDLYGLLTLRFRTVFLPGCFQLQTKGSKVDLDTREMMPRVLLAVLGNTCRVLQ